MDKIEINNSGYEWNIYEAWLNQVDGIGRQKMKRFCALGANWKEIYEADKESLHNIVKLAYGQNGKEKDSESGIGVRRIGERSLGDKTIQRDLDAILAARKDSHPEQIYEEMVRKGIHYVNYRNNFFPEKLTDIPDSPYAIYVKGQPFRERKCGSCGSSRSEKPVVAIIGARMCSAYGKYAADMLGRTAAELGMGVVSGLASGIDGIAQNAARLAGGEVTAVLGCGVDICYPSQNRKIYDGILECGRVISEYPPGTLPLGQNFPPRNRIISGLSDAVVVVEAKKKSGTLITVDMALEQGKDIYAIPGRVTDPMSAGCNRLISQGAQIVADPTETMLEIRDGSLHNMKNVSNVETEQEADTDADTDKDKVMDADTTAVKSENERKENDKIGINRMTIEAVILQALDVHPKSVQEIYESVNAQTEISLSQLQNKLLCMEMTGEVIENGGRYERKMQWQTYLPLR